jgi:hypothetical protein
MSFSEMWALMSVPWRVVAVLLCAAMGVTFALAIGDDGGSLSLAMRVTMGVFFGAAMLFFGAPRFLKDSARLHASRGDRPPGSSDQSRPDAGRPLP